MLGLPLALLAAVVVEDQASLRAAPRADAPRQAALWRGDWLEVRGETLGWLKVYDHRRERPGYVLSGQARTYPVDAPSAPALAAVIDFVKDTPGAESLGIGLVALYLRAAPAAQVGWPTFDALGTMAERLARRASRARPNDPAPAAHLEVAASYGLRFAGVTRGESARVCYDGEAYRRVLALGASAEAKARAALGLTEPECVDEALGPVERQTLDEWRLAVLDAVDALAAPPLLANRVRLRRARVAAALAWLLARRGAQAAAAHAGERALAELARVDRAQLPDAELALREEAAVAAAAARWASEPPAPRPKAPAIALRPGRPGETCLIVGDLSPCTYGLVWESSIRVAPGGAAVAVAVQPLPHWVELWLLRKQGGSWRLDVLAPAVTTPELGYVELAGFSPSGDRILLAREARVDGAWQRRFQILVTETLAVEKEARSLAGFPSFRRWAAPLWRARTLALR